MQTSVVIIGSGPAGYTAGIYVSRANLKPILFEGFGVSGGQLMMTLEVENYPGFPLPILGPDLIGNFRKQAINFGTEIISENVVEVNFSSRPFLIKSSSREVYADAVIIATGATAKKLQVPGIEEFWQKGVTACAVCDGAAPIFRNRDLFVVGGGDSAVEEALFLTKYARKVFIVHYRDKFKASPIMAKRAMENPNIEILWNNEVVRVEGDKVVRFIVVRNVVSKKEERREAAGLFMAIGHRPNTEFLRGQLELDSYGYIIVKKGSSYTSKEGVFAAGDVQDPIYRQVVTAAGSGCMAALDSMRWLHII